MSRITGVDFVERLAATGEPMFLLGAGPGVADLATIQLKERIAGTQIVGMWSDGSSDPVHDQPALDRISGSRARIVAVAYGAPNQVLWIQRNQAALAGAGSAWP